MCCWCVFSSLIPAGPLKRNGGFLLTAALENCGYNYTITTKQLLSFISWSDFITLVHGLRLHVFSVVSLLQSPLSLCLIPLPGALDRRALGAVLHLMAHTVSRITPPIASLRTRLPRRAWDPRNTLLADSTWGPHLTIAGGAWDTWRKKGNRGNEMTAAWSLPGTLILRKKCKLEAVCHFADSCWHSDALRLNMKLLLLLIWLTLQQKICQESPHQQKSLTEDVMIVNIIRKTFSKH